MLQMSYTFLRVIDIPFLMQEIEDGLRLASEGKVINAPVSFMHKVNNLKRLFYFPWIFSIFSPLIHNKTP
jgi:hypothetical protein